MNLAGSRADLLPTFLIIGAMKAGTTSLFDRLATHPDIGMASNKEPDFFIAEKNLGRGLDWYCSLFAGTEHALARGEASTSYSKCTEFAGVPQRIHALLPEVQLVYLLRDPIDRIRSMYQHNVLQGRERRPIDEAVLTDGMYVGGSSYALQMEQYLAVFPAERLHVLTVEDLRASPEAALRELCAHLGVNWYPPLLSHDPRSNATAERRADTAAARLLKRTGHLERLQRHAPRGLKEFGKRILTRDPAPALNSTWQAATDVELRDRLQADVTRLESLLGRSLDSWRRKAV